MMDIRRSLLKPGRVILLAVVAGLCVVFGGRTLWGYLPQYAPVHRFDIQAAPSGGDSTATASVRTARALSQGLPEAAAHPVCSPDEAALLKKIVPLHEHWHRLRHTQWQIDEITAPILEALVKEETGQDGTARGRGPIFWQMFAVLEAASPADAALIKAGNPASTVLATLRDGAAERTRDVTRGARQFVPYLHCLSTHHQALQYLSTLNQMPNVPDPIVDPDGTLGRFIGAYMRKHLIVDHEAITQGILTAALQAYQSLQASARLAPSREASLMLLAQALEQLNPTIGSAVRQGDGNAVLSRFLENRHALNTLQEQAVQEYEGAYRKLPPAYQEALTPLAPPALQTQETPPVALAERRQMVGEGFTERRLALVIGNAAYKELPLRNPLNDARAMARSLQEVGFEVIERTNLARRAMEDEIRAFGKQLTRGGVGLFYFAGHGLQVDGSNYLLPIGSVIDSEQDVPYEAVNAGRVLSVMEAAANHLNIVILDACRNNPLVRGWKTPGNGFSVMDAPSGTLIAYATAPGAAAIDGDREHGLYTQELLRHMRLPGVKLEDMFKRVRAAVSAQSHGQQLPWESSALVGDFYFIRP